VWTTPRRHCTFLAMAPRLNGRGTTTERGAVPAYFLYGEPLRAPDARSVHVETIAARSSLHDWTIRDHLHKDLHQILIIWSGRVEAHLDGERTQLRGPAFINIPPMTVHAFQFDKDTDGLVVTCSACLAHEILRDTGSLGEALQQAIASRIRRARLAAFDVEQLATMLLRESARTATGRDSALHGLLTTLITNLLRISAVTVIPGSSAGNREREMVAQFREALEKGYRDHLDIKEYARQIGTSEAALRKACVKVAGQSPTQLVGARILIEAERQLRYSGMSISEIAYYLGFEDPAYFSRFFAKGMGVSPRSFRRSTGKV
jgi:AraC family transcriptional regulator, transcriptional activator of pobA